MANNWTRGAAHRRTTAPISALGLHPVARELLLISRPAEGRRLSWPEVRMLQNIGLCHILRRRCLLILKKRMSIVNYIGLDLEHTCNDDIGRLSDIENSHN